MKINGVWPLDWHPVPRREKVPFPASFLPAPGTAAQRTPRADAPPGGGRRGGGGAQGSGPQPQTTLEMHLAEYKAVNGIKLPHLITRGADGTTQEELKIKSFKINPNFKADTFTQ